VRDSLDKQRQQPDWVSPKKFRSTFGPRQGPKQLHCIVCEGEDQNELRKASTDKVEELLKEWASTTKNWILYSRLTACSDTHAMDAYYHIQCYLRLRDSARAVESRSSSVGSTATPFNSMVNAQLIAFVDDSRTEVVKLSALRELYKTMMSDRGCPCSGREPHSARFKDHLLHHLPEWTEFAQGTDVFVSHKVIVGTVLAQTYHSSHIDQN
jgi:hypothetical protein